MNRAVLECGGRTTYLLTQKTMKNKAVVSEVWSWGFNKHGQCGVGSEAEIVLPTRVSFPTVSNAHVVSVHAGTRYALCRAAGGEIFVFGSPGFLPRQVVISDSSASH